MPTKTSNPQKKKTFHFKSEFTDCTQRRRRDLRGRMFAEHTILDMRVISASEMRLCYIETLSGLRHNGFASDALSWLCELADEYECNISLTPCSYDEKSMNTIRLTAWYQKFGFVRIGFNDEMMRYYRSANN